MEPSSSPALESIIKQARQIDKESQTATLWSCPEVLDEKLDKEKEDGNQKLTGIGAVAGFLGGSGFSFDSRLASYSVYHRQERLAN